MIERVGNDQYESILQYLWRYDHENIHLLDDLVDDSARQPWDDVPTLLGYRADGRIAGVQAFYRYGRWFPHYDTTTVVDSMIEDMMLHRVSWILGVQRIVDPMIERLQRTGFAVGYDEIDHICSVDARRLRPYHCTGIRRATDSDLMSVGELRYLFEAEYFGVAPYRVDRNWCNRIAGRYITKGTYVAVVDGRIVAMAAVEARIPSLVQIGAVFTKKHYRGKGYAKGVVSALCEELLAVQPAVSLTVRIGNQPAIQAYASLGFRRTGSYRMARIS